jgi:hypothetical protein
VQQALLPDHSESGAKNFRGATSPEITPSLPSDQLPGHHPIDSIPTDLSAVRNELKSSVTMRTLFSTISPVDTFFAVNVNEVSKSHKNEKRVSDRLATRFALSIITGM